MSNKIFRKSNTAMFGLAIFSCAACCALPVLAVAFGLAGVTAFVPYLEKVALGLFLVALLLSIGFWWKANRAPVCTTECECKTQSGE